MESSYLATKTLAAYHSQMSEALEFVNSEFPAAIDLERSLYSIAAHLKAFKVELVKVLSLGLDDDQHNESKVKYQNARSHFDDLSELVFSKLEQLI